MMKENVLIDRGIHPTAAKTLTAYANYGLAKNTWSSYQTVRNHIERCESDMNVELSLPFNVEKTLTFVAWLMEVRKVKALTIEKYLLFDRF